jgi:hypothetical protein
MVKFIKVRGCPGEAPCAALRAGEQRKPPKP